MSKIKTIAAVALSFQALAVEASENQHMNVLFLIVDDLRPELGCYGRDVISPNIDKLASEGVRFANSYCNIAVSGASRSSLLTGTRPTRNTFMSAHIAAIREKPDMTGLNDHLKAYGYTTYSEGKVYHQLHDHRSGWSISNKISEPAYALPSSVISKDGKQMGAAYECADVEDNFYFDGITADNAAETLEKLAKDDKPFFAAVGFYKPHIPYVAPKKYWDLYDFDDITLPSNFVMPECHNLPEQIFNRPELTTFAYTPKDGVLSDPIFVRKMIHGYKACVSYSDALVGKVLDKLSALGLDDNTVVVLIGDHGYNLAEHGCWEKHSLFNTSVHGVTIVRDPRARLKNYTSNEIIEFVDLFPTICDLAGIPSHPQCEGESFASLLNDPNAKHKGYAITRWLNGFGLNTQDGFSYCEWWDENDNIEDRVLFDHNIDSMENHNVVENSIYASKVAEFSKILMENRGADFNKYEAVIYNKK